jgi:preprotein translocase subunit Sec63
MKGPPKPPDLLDCYEVLGLNEHASSLDIEKAYKRCRLAYHPDSKRAGAQPSTELFQNVSTNTLTTETRITNTELLDRNCVGYTQEKK